MQKIINNQFVIQKQIAEGSFGTVFLAIDLKTNLEVAVKVENDNDEVFSFEREIRILKHLNGVNGIPKMLWNGFELKNNFIVVELLGKDLENQTKSLQSLSMKSLVQMAVQIIQILERMHKLRVVHRDLKPDNILLGLGENKSRFYLIDFGISKIYKNGYGQDVEISKIKSFIGTSRYASVAAHKGHHVGRKDDIESLMYVLVYFYKGILPWQNMSFESQEERTYKVGQMKETINLNDLCRQMPSEFKQIFMYLRILDFSTEPDYSYILKQFFMIAKHQKFILDDQYEWSQKRSLISGNFQQQIGQLIPPPLISLGPIQNKQAIDRTQSPNMVIYRKDFQVVFDEKIQFPQQSNI